MACSIHLVQILMLGFFVLNILNLKNLRLMFLTPVTCSLLWLYILVNDRQANGI